MSIKLIIEQSRIFSWLYDLLQTISWFHDWQKEASDKSDISRKTAKCVCHLHWRQWNIMMSYLTYFLVGWVFLCEIKLFWPGRRAHDVNYETMNNSNSDGMSLASFAKEGQYCFLQFTLAMHVCIHIHCTLEFFLRVLTPPLLKTRRSLLP